MLASLAAAGALAVATAQANDSDDGPLAQTLAPSDVTNTSATLHGTVDADRRPTTYWFDIGPTTAYGAHTQAATTDKNDSRRGAEQRLGAGQGRRLPRAPGGAQRARPFARRRPDLHGRGAGRARPCASATGGAACHGRPGRRSRCGRQAPRAPSHPPRRPRSDESVGVDEQAGSVLVRVPGSPRPVAITEAASVPVGSIVDARKGTVVLSSAVSGDASQTGTFHGGIFQVRQPAGAGGMTELVLRGPLPVCAAGGARAAAVSAKRPPRALWGRDDHGRFRTRGSNSVATVRGTAWYVEDRCDGTLTRVSKGSVSVRELHRKRTVIVNAGKSYLARPALTR